MTTDRAPDVPLAQVEWRVQGTVNNGGVNVVAYLDAPTVSGLLDEWVGPFRWKDTYEPVGNGEKALWCHLSVKAEDEWITKVDLGVPSNMEAAKGLVSDAFKRVAMRKWRVGANVFDLPILRISKFRTYEKNGKTQAVLTGQSAQEIKERLTALGFEDAAEQTRVATRDDDPTTDEPAVAPRPVTPAPSGEGDSPAPSPDLPAVEQVDVLLEALPDVDADAWRARAAKGPKQAAAVVDALRKQLESGGEAA